MPLVLDPIQSGYNLSKINENFEKIEATWDEKLDRVNSGSFYNQMEQELDMNSNRIINHPNARIDDVDNTRDLVLVEDITKLGAFDGVIPTVDSYVGDGARTVFSFSSVVKDVRAVQVYIEGLRQEPNTDYTLSGPYVVFNTPPVADAEVDIYAYNPIIIENGVPVYVEPVLAEFEGDGITTTFSTSATGSSTGAAFVSVDGVNQVPYSDFTNVGGNIIFENAPPVNSVIFVRIFAPYSEGTAEFLTVDIKTLDLAGQLVRTAGHSVYGVGSAVFASDSEYTSGSKAGANPEVLDQKYIVYDKQGNAYSLITTYGETKRHIVATQIGALPDAGFYNSTDGWWYVDQAFTKVATDNSDAFGTIKELSDAGDCWVDFGSGRYQVTRQTIFESIRSVFSGGGKESCKIVSPRVEHWTGGDSLIEFGNNVNSDNIAVRGMFFDAINTTGVSGCSLNIRYNADFNHCQFKSGPYDEVNSIECAGLRVKKAKHTRLDHCNLNNNNCYSILFADPAGGNVSLSDFICDTCAFDESQAGIVIRGLVQELVLQECTFGGLGNGGSTGTSPAANHQLFGDATINSFKALGTTFGGGYLTDFGLRFNGSSNQVVSISNCRFSQFLRYPIMDVSTQSAELSVTGCDFRNNGTAGGSTNINDWTNDYLTCPYTTDIYILRADQGKKSFSNNTSDISNKFNVVADPTNIGVGGALWEYEATQNFNGGARIGSLEATDRVGVSKGKLYKINELIATGFAGFGGDTVPASSSLQRDVAVDGLSTTHRVEWSFASNYNPGLIATARVTSTGTLSFIVSNVTGSDLSFPSGNLFYDIYERSNN